uniref:Uncharacterized protein n=1 Tax=uncultured prokaryote TaxID=198431 RepID=A0A0H5Q5K7_9ZZZZ|nr:hypothetical protein [uncultured prokaryote]
MATFRLAVDINWTHGSGSPGANVWHGRTTSGLDGSEIGGLVDDLEAFYTSIASLYTSDTVLSFSGEVAGVGDDADDSLVVPGWTVTGSGSPNALSTALQLCISWRTGSGGRSGRGRTFIGPFNASTADANGLPLASKTASLNAAAAALVAAGGARGNGSFGVYSPTDNVIRDFVSGAAANKFAILRSRRD